FLRCCRDHRSPNRGRATSWGAAWSHRRQRAWHEGSPLCWNGSDGRHLRETAGRRAGWTSPGSEAGGSWPVSLGLQESRKPKQTVLRFRLQRRQPALSMTAVRCRVRKRPTLTAAPRTWGTGQTGVTEANVAGSLAATRHHLNARSWWGEVPMNSAGGALLME